MAHDEVISSAMSSDDDAGADAQPRSLPLPVGIDSELLSDVLDPAQGAFFHGDVSELQAALDQTSARREAVQNALRNVGKRGQALLAEEAVLRQRLAEIQQHRRSKGTSSPAHEAEDSDSSSLASHTSSLRGRLGVGKLASSRKSASALAAERLRERSDELERLRERNLKLEDQLEDKRMLLQRSNDSTETSPLTSPSLDLNGLRRRLSDEYEESLTSPGTPAHLGGSSGSSFSWSMCATKTAPAGTSFRGTAGSGGAAAAGGASALRPRELRAELSAAQRAAARGRESRNREIARLRLEIEDAQSNADFMVQSLQETIAEVVSYNNTLLAELSTAESQRAEHMALLHQLCGQTFDEDRYSGSPDSSRRSSVASSMFYGSLPSEPQQQSAPAVPLSAASAQVAVLEADLAAAQARSQLRRARRLAGLEPSPLAEATGAQHGCDGAVFNEEEEEAEAEPEHSDGQAVEGGTSEALQIEIPVESMPSIAVSEPEEKPCKKPSEHDMDPRRQRRISESTTCSEISELPLRGVSTLYSEFGDSSSSRTSLLFNGAASSSSDSPSGSSPGPLWDRVFDGGLGGNRKATRRTRITNRLSVMNNSFNVTGILKASKAFKPEQKVNEELESATAPKPIEEKKEKVFQGKGVLWEAPSAKSKSPRPSLAVPPRTQPLRKPEAASPRGSRTSWIGERVGDALLTLDALSGNGESAETT